MSFFLLVLWVLLHVQDNPGSVGLCCDDVSRSLGFVLSVASHQLPTVSDSFMETGRQRENPPYFAKSKKWKDSGGFKQQQIGHLPVRKQRRNLSPLTQF